MLMSNNLDSTKILLVATLLSIDIAKDKSADELYFWGNLLICIGSNLYTIASTKVLNETTSNPDLPNQPSAE